MARQRGTDPPVEGVTPNPSASESTARSHILWLSVGPSAQAMFFNFNLFAIVALFSEGVYARTLSTTDVPTPTTLSEVPSCIQGCAQSAFQTAGGSCTSITDPCVCTNTGFQQTANQCLATQCSDADQATALQLKQALCGQ